MIDLNSTKTKRHAESDLVVSRIDAVANQEHRLSELQRIATLELPPEDDWWGRSISASMVGDECARRMQLSVWPSFHSYTPTRAPLTERDRRIFARGHESEALMVEWMLRAGFGISTLKPATESDESQSNRRQYGFITANGQIKGYADGIFLARGVKHLWEHKTLNTKSFRAAYNNGVVKAHPKYDAQTQLMMAYMNAEATLFTILNADDGALYAETVAFNASRAQTVSDRAVRVLQATRAGDLLPKGGTDGDKFPCGWRDKVTGEMTGCRFRGECWK